MYYYPGRYYDRWFDRTPRRFSKSRYIFKSFFVSEKDFVNDLPFFFKDFHLKTKRFLDKSWALPAKHYKNLKGYNKDLNKNFRRQRYFKNYFKKFINTDIKNPVTLKSWNKYFVLKKYRYPWKKNTYTKYFEYRYSNYHDRSVTPFVNLNFLIKKFLILNRTGFYFLLLFLFFFKPFSVINNFKNLFDKCFFNS